MNNAGCMDKVADLLGGGRTIAYKTDLAHAAGSVTAGLLLSQFWYWANSRDVTDRDGWFWKTMPEITDETGLTRTEQENARKKLVHLGILHEQRRGTPAKLWFRLDKDALYDLLACYLADKNGGNPQSSLRETCKQECGKPATKSADNPQSSGKEITAETTTQNTAADTGDPSRAAAASNDVLRDRNPAVDQELQRQLVENGVNRKDATRLARAFPDECRTQLSYLPFVAEFKSTRGAYLRSAIEQGFGAPRAFLEEQAKVETARKEEERRRATDAKRAEREAQRQEIIEYLGRQIESLKTEAPVFYDGFEQEFQREKEGQLKAFGDSRLRERLESFFSSEERRAQALLDYLATKPCPLPDLAQWLSQHPVAEIQRLLSSPQ